MNQLSPIKLVHKKIEKIRVLYLNSNIDVDIKETLKQTLKLFI